MSAPHRHLVPAWSDGVLRPCDKLDVHRRGLRHMAVSVFVLAGDQVLLQRRAAGKYHTPGLWANSCCTHPFWQEDPQDCAVRRLKEELGLMDLALQRVGQVEYRAEVGQGLIEHEVVDVFLAHVAAPMQPAPDPDEVSATRWVGLATLLAEIETSPEVFTPWLRIYLQDHRAQLFPHLT